MNFEGRAKMELNARLYCKPDDLRTEPCVVDKTIEISRDDFARLCKQPLRDFDFIDENKQWMGCDQHGKKHCLLVLGKGYDDGVLIFSSGYSYARYCGSIPNARQLVSMEQRYNCIQDLENRLTGAADEIIPRALAYDGEGVFRFLINDLTDDHGIEKTYVPLLADMLCEHPDINNVDIFDGEICISVNRQEEKQGQLEQLPGPAPLPYAPERMEQLLDKALDLIGNQESGGELYNTLVDQLGMSNAEITAAGFETLSEYFEGPDEGEAADIKLE